MKNEKAQIIIGNIPIKPEVLDDCYSIAEYQEAKAMAIKALEQTELKSSYNSVKTELKPCDDAISREEVMKLLEKEDWADTVEGVLALPPVTPQPKVGHWMDMSEGFSTYECSECEQIEFKKSKYCPNCGAKMVELKESEDEE